MDVVLTICNDLFLDKAWATLLPLSAFADLSTPSVGISAALNASRPMNPSSWAQFVSSLPHPTIPPINLSTSSLNDLASMSAWPRDYVPRQLISLTLITLIGIHALYFIFASLSYYFIFNHDMMKHPRFLKNQVWLEIQTSLWSFPGMTMLTLPWFQFEVMGYSKLYDEVDTYGWPYLIFSIVFFLLVTDYCIYWIHRWLHLPVFYKYIHKPHHKWIIPTPFSSHAFHPLDGYAQSLPYHFFIFFFPLQRQLYLGLFVFVNCWSIFIHDSDMISGHPLERIINGPSHHTLHHIYFNVNYGQYFTWADRTYNSYRQPQSDLDPLLEVKALEAEKQKQESRKDM